MRQSRRMLWAVVGTALLFAGCEAETLQSKTVQGAALGSALGAGTGAIIGHQTGRAGEGTAIGAGLGALAGGLIGHGMESSQKQQQAAPASTTTAKPVQYTKFCPVGGELYTDEYQYCPTHGVELKPRGQ